MRDHKPGWGNQIHKIEEIKMRLIQHEKRVRVTLILLVVLNAILLALVVSHLWEHPWMQDSIQGVVP
ncbi:hypothetical protein [Microvirga pakistanensis]|uniref:hypothetical protein n=1 Tax=Microvirga pakistanensis TaxID=1682650 RepID=UPI00106B762E|nr:hypothetical protein [Microvirga pakistanensis]